MREFVLALGMAFVPVTGILLALWISARARADKAESVIREIALGRFGRESQLKSGDAQMTHALDAIALEVERIAEGQRFTTKLLSEHREPSANAPRYRVNTPH